MPDYPWTCGACAAVNAPNHAVCATCACPAHSSRKQRLAYLAAHEGTGPAVVTIAPAQVGPPRRRPARMPGTAWWIAAAVFALVAVLAFILLWGGGPLLGPMGGSAGSTAHEFWELPDWLSLGSLVTVLLAPLAALACAVVAALRRRRMPPAVVLGWGGLALIVLLLACCR